MIRILAQERVLEEIRTNFTNYWSEHALVSAIVLALLALVLAAVQQILRPYVQRRAEEQRLWKALADAHALSRADQEVLRRLATDCGLASPSEVFVRRSLFDQQIGRGKDTARLTELRAKLF